MTILVLGVIQTVLLRNAVVWQKTQTVLHANHHFSFRFQKTLALIRYAQQANISKSILQIPLAYAQYVIRAVQSASTTLIEAALHARQENSSGIILSKKGEAKVV